MVSRRSLLAGCGVALTGGLSGCVGFLGGSGNDTPTEPEEDLTADESATVVAFADGISGWVRTVSHNPAESVATVEGAIDVKQEQDYRVRLGVVDDNGVVLEDTVSTETLYNVGTNTVTAEFDDVGDCDSCHSGLLHVDYPENSSYGGGEAEVESDGSGSNNNDSDSDSGSDSDSNENSNGGNNSSEENQSGGSAEKTGGDLGTLGSNGQENTDGGGD